MPGPIVKPGNFPGVDKLPPLAQQLLKMFFPPDEMPIGGTFGGALGMAAPKPSFAPRELFEEVMEQFKRLHKGRGTHMQELKELMPDYEMPANFPREDLRSLITDPKTEPSAKDYWLRAYRNPEARKFMRDYSRPGWDGTYWDYELDKVFDTPKEPADISQEGLERLLRFLAD